MPHATPTEDLVADLEYVKDRGAIASYRIRPAGKRGSGRRRILVTLPDGDTLDRGPIWVEAFALGVRIAFEVWERRNG